MDNTEVGNKIAQFMGFDFAATARAMQYVMRLCVGSRVPTCVSSCVRV